MSNIVDVRLVTPVNGCSRLTFLAENITTGIAKIFSIKMSVPDQGITYNLGTLKGRVPETQYNVDCNGQGIGLTSGNTTYTEGTLSITYGDDYNQLQSIDPTIARNIVKAVYEGSSFKIGADTYTVIGTNGTRNIGAFSNTQDFRYLLLKEGEVITPDLKNADGTMATETNNFVTAYKKNNMVAAEFLYAFSDTEKKGDRFPYVLASDYNFNEGSSADYNRYEITAARYCDPKSIDKYFIDGLTNAQTLATTGTTALYRVNCDIIIEVSGGGTPTVAGTAGKQAAVIDSDDNTVAVYKHNGTGWDTVPVTSVLGQGCILYSQSFDTALDGATAVTKAGYVAIKTAGATGAAVAVNAKTGASGSGTATAIFDCMDWVYSTQTFTTYTGTEI